MAPTINQVDDVVVFEKLSPRLGLVRSGDIVLYRAPRPEAPRRTEYIRVFALAGEHLPGGDVVPEGKWVSVNDESGRPQLHAVVDQTQIIGRICFRFGPSPRRLYGSRAVGVFACASRVVTRGRSRGDGRSPPGTWA